MQYMLHTVSGWAADRPEVHLQQQSQELIEVLTELQGSDCMLPQQLTMQPPGSGRSHAVVLQIMQGSELLSAGSKRRERVRLPIALQVTVQASADDWDNGEH